MVGSRRTDRDIFIILLQNKLNNNIDVFLGIDSSEETMLYLKYFKNRYPFPLEGIRCTYASSIDKFCGYYIDLENYKPN